MTDEFTALTVAVLVTALCSAAAFEGLMPLPPRAAEPQPKKCHQSRSHKMMYADCSERNLMHVPANLRTDIEVLELTFNRIRELDNSSFSRYESVRFLFLADNMISHIEGGAFAPLMDLEVLDLTLNSLHRVPEAIQNLPVLQKLYLASNQLAGSAYISIVFEPLPSLQVLTLDNCKLRQLPNLSTLPALQFLNVSGNRIKSIDLHQMAPLCRLKKLDLKGNSGLYRQEHCRCQLLTTWLAKREVQLWPEPEALCKNTLDSGRKVDNSSTCFTNETRLIFEESEVIARSCESEVLQYGSGPLRIKTSVLWALVAAGFCLFVVVCFFSTYCLRKKRSKRTDRSTDRLTVTGRS